MSCFTSDSLFVIQNHPQTVWKFTDKPETNIAIVAADGWAFFNCLNVMDLSWNKIELIITCLRFCVTCKNNKKIPFKYQTSHRNGCQGRKVHGAKDKSWYFDNTAFNKPPDYETINVSVDNGLATTGTRQVRVRDCDLYENLENVFILPAQSPITRSFVNIFNLTQKILNSCGQDKEPLWLNQLENPYSLGQHSPGFSILTGWSTFHFEAILFQTLGFSTIDHFNNFTGCPVASRFRVSSK